MITPTDPQPQAARDGEAPVSARADLLSSLVWLALGGAIVAASWRMDRLESQGAKIYTAPGLYPGLLGGVLVLLGLVLAWRASQAGGWRRGVAVGTSPAASRGARLRVGGFLLLAFAYAGGMVGRGGMPFWLATFVFVAGTIALFEWRTRRDLGEGRRGIIVAIAMGAGTSFLVSYVFQELFLVRLP